MGPETDCRAWSDASTVGEIRIYVVDLQKDSQGKMQCCV